jgi:hypothetical protein
MVGDGVDAGLEGVVVRWDDGKGADALVEVVDKRHLDLDEVGGASGEGSFLATEPRRHAWPRFFSAILLAAIGRLGQVEASA